MKTALKFITCGSVDDGKSTLIGRLLVDSKSVLQDQLAGVQRQGETDLALLTDGLSAEREQGITIDVAWRYFSSPVRKFIIGDCPGHEQYTRNMVTAASQADAAVVLVDATKLAWQDAEFELLVQTKRHSMLLHRLRVAHIVYAVNKLDALGDGAAAAFAAISTKLRGFAEQAGVAVHAVVAISALKGYNVVHPAQDAWAGYMGAPLLQLLEALGSEGEAQTAESKPKSAKSHGSQAAAFSVQWVEKQSALAQTDKGRRVFWGSAAEGLGDLAVGDTVHTHPSGQTAVVAHLFSSSRQDLNGAVAGSHAGVVLDREIDLSRGDWILTQSDPTLSEQPSQPLQPVLTQQTLSATLAWLDAEPATVGRAYWALHGHRWVKAKISAIDYAIDVNTLAQTPAHSLAANALAQVQISLQAPVPVLSFAQSKTLGSMLLVDPASNHTAGAVMLQGATASSTDLNIGAAT